MKRLALLSAVLAVAACGGPPPLQIHTERPVHLNGGHPGLKVADAALEGGIPDTALAITRGLLEANPRNVAALVKQGEALAAMNRPDAAAECYRRALAVDPKSKDALIALGRSALANGQPPEAEAQFRRVLAFAPNNAQAQNNLGIALDMQDRHAEAQAAYRSALQVAPDMNAASVNLGLSYALAGDSNHALSILQPLAADPDSSERVRHDFAAALTLAGDPASAAALLYTDTPRDQVQAAVSGFQALQAAR